MFCRMQIVHVVNPLHVYCRLVKIVGYKHACKISKLYEKYIFMPCLVPILHIDITNTKRKEV